MRPDLGINPNQKVNKRPLLSIVTVVKNGDIILEKTILNVINQSYTQIEYIIIDGGSTDNTLAIIKKYDASINYWISEPDKGIYDAMNKGIKKATGDWINFMNAGDEFYDLNTCKKIAENISNNDFDIIYGDFAAKNNVFNSEILIKAKHLNSIWKGNMFSHQSCFIKSGILRNNLFNLKYSIVADYDQIISIYLQNHSFFYLAIPIARTLTGGVSYSNLNTYIEQIKVVHSRKPYTLRLYYFIFPIFLNFLRIIIGTKATTFVRQMKWKILSHNLQ